MPGLAPGLVVDVEVLAQPFGGHRHGHDPVAVAARVLVRFGGRVGGDHELRTRLLRRARQRRRALERVEPAVRGDVLFAQQQIDLFDPLAEARDRLVARDAESPELVRQKRAAEPDVSRPFEIASSIPISPATLSGWLNAGITAPVISFIVVVRSAQAGQHQDRARTVAAVRREVVLDRAHVGVAELLGRARRCRTTRGSRLRPAFPPR